MAIRQYVGARYVTKIYENSQDPLSAEWESNTAYEPLTMVTYNNSSFLSRKQVPNNIGDPVTNPTYWAQTGFYNGQIASLQAQITAIHAFLDTAAVLIENEASDTTVPLEVANFGGQGTSDDLRSFVIHHYTDADCERIDNVGSAPALMLVNAHNAIRRPDKPSTYHGDGEYMRMMIQHDYDEDNEWVQENIGIIDKNGDIWRSGFDNTGNPARNHTFEIGTNKLDGGTYAFKLQAYNSQSYFLSLVNGNTPFMDVKEEGTGGLSITAPSGESPVKVGNAAGILYFDSSGAFINVDTGKAFQVYIGGVPQYPTYDVQVCTSTTRPTTGIHTGSLYKEVDTHKIIWYDGANWYDAAGNLV